MNVDDIALVLVTSHLDLVSCVVLIILPEQHNAFEAPETSNLV